jgi:surface antigen
MFSLLFLPFRIVINLTRILIRLAVRALWLPLYFVSHHLFLTFMVVLAIIVAAQLHSCSEKKKDAQLPSAQQSAPGPLAVDPQLRGAAMPQTRKGQPVQIDPVLKVEDGDSAFASDLYAAMTEPERNYYSAFFFWAMNNLPDGAAYPWTNGNIAGSIQPVQSFNNKYGDRCRAFREELKVHTVKQNITGTACRNGHGTWCKLKPNATPMCGLGYNPGFFEGLWGSVRNLF